MSKLKGAVGAVVATNKMGGEAIKVVVRCRPLNKKELNEKRNDVIKIDKDLGQISIKPDKNSPPEDIKTFTFNAVYGPDSRQRDVYDETAFPLVEQVFDGYNGSIFAYGQTGCGKSWSMMGVATDENLRGIIPNAFIHIFEKIAASPPDAGVEFLVRASYIEIYNEQVRDLLGVDAKASMDLKEDPEKGVYVKDLTTVVVRDYSEIEAAIEQGNSVREVGATAMNADSSRSHSIFTAVIETSEKLPDAKEGDKPKIKAGKLNLIDLAGSERQAKTEAKGQRLLEATKINLSLSALGNVIAALSLGKKGHIPYRDSKLTRLLQDSLGGNSKTVMLTAVSPADYNFDETLSTLRYANRAKNIKNKPKINEDPKDALLRQFQDEIARLQAMLEGKVVSTVAPVAAAAAADAGGAVAPAGGATAPTGGGAAPPPDGGAAQNGEEMPAAAAAREQMQEMLETERNERLAMEEQLQALKAKLLHSDGAGSDIIQGPSLLEAGNAAAEHQAAVSRRQRDEMEEEERLHFDEEFDDLSKEVAAKSKKLKALRKKHKTLVADQQEREMEFQTLGADLMETVRSVTRDFALYRTIANAHVDVEVLLECEVSAVYDDEGQIWVLPATQGPEARQGQGRLRNGRSTPNESTSTQPLPTMGLESAPKFNDGPSSALVETPIDLGPLAATNQGLDDVRERLALQPTEKQQPPPAIDRPKSRGERPRSRGDRLKSRVGRSRGADSLSSPSAAVMRGVTTSEDGPAQQGNKSAAEQQQASANRVVQRANAAASKATAMLPSLGEQTEQKAIHLVDTYGAHDASRAVHLALPMARRNELVKLWGASQQVQIATNEIIEGRHAAAVMAAKLQLAPLSGSTPDIVPALTNDAKTLSDLQADTRAAALLRADRMRWETRSGTDGEQVRQLHERNLRAEEELAVATVENAWLKEELRREKERHKTENWEVALRMLKEQEEQSGAAATVSAITL